MKPITVFTPTLNRKNKISRVYESLKNQKKELFEWVIVDDGSTDGTGQLISAYQKENIIEIKYVYQKNSGKHVSHNRALDISNGILFLILDSDDQILPDKLNVIWDTWQTYGNGNEKKYAGILAHCINQHKEFIGKKWANNVKSRSVIQLWIEDEEVYGEKMPVYQTHILKRCKFPVLKGSSELVPEGIVWMQIAKKYEMILLEDITRIYEMNNQDALSISAKDDQIGSWGKAIFFSVLISFSNKYFLMRPVRFIKVAINVSRYRYISKISLKEQLEYIDNKFALLLVIIFMPLAKIYLYIKKLKKEKY